MARSDPQIQQSCERHVIGTHKLLILSALPPVITLRLFVFLDSCTTHFHHTSTVSCEPSRHHSVTVVTLKLTSWPCRSSTKIGGL